MPRLRSSLRGDDQIDRFKALARELECDEDEAAFKQKLALIARQKPKDESNPEGDAKP